MLAPTSITVIIGLEPNATIEPSSLLCDSLSSFFTFVFAVVAIGISFLVVCFVSVSAVAAAVSVKRGSVQLVAPVATSTKYDLPVVGSLRSSIVLVNAGDVVSEVGVVKRESTFLVLVSFLISSALIEPVPTWEKELLTITSLAIFEKPDDDLPSDMT